MCSATRRRVVTLIVGEGGIIVPLNRKNRALRKKEEEEGKESGCYSVGGIR